MPHGPQGREESWQGQILASLLQRMPTTGQRIELDWDGRTGIVVLSGVVGTFYAKQFLFHSCRRLVPGYEVVDALVVEDDLPPACWAGALRHRG
ncbi:MAG TPA: hypothetical protein VGG64_19610 [Pirellulales bacterium]